MANSLGGGINRSNRLNGNCNYSYNNPNVVYTDTDGDQCNEQVLMGCINPATTKC